MEMSQIWTDGCRDLCELLERGGTDLDSPERVAVLAETVANKVLLVIAEELGSAISIDAADAPVEMWVVIQPPLPLPILFLPSIEGGGNPIPIRLLPYHDIERDGLSDLQFGGRRARRGKRRTGRGERARVEIDLKMCDEIDGYCTIGRETRDERIVPFVSRMLIGDGVDIGEGLAEGGEGGAEGFGVKDFCPGLFAEGVFEFGRWGAVDYLDGVAIGSASRLMYQLLFLQSSTSVHASGSTVLTSARFIPFTCF